MILCNAAFASENEIVIPLKTKYAPKEREVILGSDTSHSGTQDKWTSSLEVEYSFFDPIEFDFELPFVNRFPKSSDNQSGIGDIETAIKAFYSKEDLNFYLAGGNEATWHTGITPKDHGEDLQEVGPFIAVAKGVGALSLLGDFSYERVVNVRGEEAQEAKKNSYKVDAALAYTFPFGLSPLLEVNSHFAKEKIVLMTPGLIYAFSDRFQTRAGVQVPVTKDEEFNWKAVFQLLYDFD